MIEGKENAPAVAGTNERYMQFPIAWGAYEYQRQDLFSEGSAQHYEGM